MSNLPWFRLYHRIIDDEKVRLLAFEDRWHFVAICCLKADGLLDEPASNLKDRKIAVKLGVQARELDEIKRRLSEVGLVDENMQPVAWDELQYRSDNSTDRVRKYREKTKVKRDETERNVSVTAQDTDTEVEGSSLRSEPIQKKRAREFDLDEKAFQSWFSSWPTFTTDDEDKARSAWQALTPDDRRAAASETPAYVATVRANKRTFFAADKFLSKRLWERAKVKPPPTGTLAAIAGKTQTREEYLAAEKRRSERSFQ